jgi:RHS repeat-associated protein
MNIFAVIFRRPSKAAFLALGFLLGIGQLNSASATGYPPVTMTYPAPWLDVFSFDNTSQTYTCAAGDKGGAEACAASREAGFGNTVMVMPWFVPSNCSAFSVLRNDCYQANFGKPTGGGSTYTVVGQRCIYAAASGFLEYAESTAGGLSEPGWCLILASPERNVGCPKCKGQQTGDPINTSVGNVYDTFTDYKGKGAFPLLFTRGYNSQLANQANSPGHAAENLGQGWTSNINNHLYINSTTWPMVVCQEPSGSHRYFLCPTSGFIGTTTLEVTVWHGDGGQAIFSYPSTSAPDGTPLTSEESSNGQLFFVSTLPSPASGGGFKYLRDDGYSEYYDTTGRLVSVWDKNGLQQIYSYNTSNQLTAITDPSGRTLAFTYDGSGRIQTMTDPASQVYTYAYDTHNNLASVNYPDNTLPGGVTVQYKYENGTWTHALTGIVDENSTRYATWTYDGTTGRALSSYLGPSTLKANLVSVVYTNDSGGRVASANITEPTTQHRIVTFSSGSFVSHATGSSVPCTDCRDSAQSMSYDANGYMSSATDFNGNVTNYSHDSTGLETSRTEAYGTAYARTITTVWDPNLRQPTLITEPGRTTAYTYDAVGHVLTKTVTDTATSVARTTTYTYNTLGLLDTVNGPRTDVSDVTNYAYDTSGNLTSITNALGQITQVTVRDAHGNPTKIIDPNGVETDLAYDARQRIISRTVNTTEVTQYTYDNTGELTKITLPDGDYLQYGYDGAHRVTSVTDNLGDKIVYTLDALGNRTLEQIKNPGGTVMHTLSRSYDALNRLHQQVAGMSQTTIYGYDSLDNLTSITDPMTHVTSQGFDPLNRLQTVTDPYSGVTTYNADALDHTTDVTSPRGLNTHYDYDAFGDITELDSPDTGTTLYTYDLAGNRLTKTNNASITATYTYDALNRLTSISYPDTTKDVTYSYDSGTYGKGHLTGITDASGNTSYIYDAWGNLSGKTVVQGGHTYTVGYTYDTDNNLASVTYPGGMVVAYARDSTDQITTVTENGNIVASSIAYKPFGPIAGFSYGNGLAETRSYDLDYRVTGISIPSIQGLTFAYNANDDITGITDSISASNTQTLGYDNLNRLTSAISGTGGYGSITYGYDADGNRTSLVNGAGTATYTLDTLSNQLQSISGATTATYSYNTIGALDDDAINQYTYADTEWLDAVTDIATSSTVASYTYNALGQRTQKIVGANTFSFIYDEEGHLIGEYDASGNLIQEHIWLTDRPIGVLTASGLYYVHTDQIWTPRIITDGSHSIVWNRNSDPFGNGTPSGTLTYNLRFAGQYFDAETGDSYNYFRNYDSRIGRYIESDLIGIQGDLNTYVYALNDPIWFVDPYGLYWMSKTQPSEVPDPALVNPALQGFIICTESCLNEDLRITATTNGHSGNDPHARGTGIDFTLLDRGASANKAICCAESCGAIYVQDEYHHPSKGATGGHIHAQLDTGTGAKGTGKNPQPKCEQCKGG